MPIALGTVTAPSGTLVIVDPGYLNLWCDDRPTSTSDSAQDDADFEIVGRDAEAVGRKLDRQWNPRFLFDQSKAHAAELTREIAEIARAAGLDARLEQKRERISHRRRIALALDAGRGAGEVQFEGLWAGVVGGLPAGPLRVVAERMPEDHVEAARLRRVSILVRDGTATRSEQLAHVMVDYARLLVVDAAALGKWQADEPLDGLADLVFWGRDAEGVAAAAGAPRIEGEGGAMFGWRDVPVSVAERRGQEVATLRERHGAKLAIDFRPHSHHFQLMEQVRASPTESGIVRVGGADACGFATSWGDGIYDVFRDLDASGRLLRVRIELGTEARVELMAGLRARWFRYALVSRKVADEGAMVRFMYREDPEGDADDSGWRMFSGLEEEGYNDDPANIAAVKLADLQERDPRVNALLDEPIGSVFERVPPAVEFERVTDWAPEGDD